MRTHRVINDGTQYQINMHYVANELNTVAISDM